MERNSIFTKILSAFLIFLMIFNFNVVSFATNAIDEEDKRFEETEEDGVMDGLVGTFSSIIRIPIMLAADGVSLIIGMLGTSAGVRTDIEVGSRLTPEDVLFNRLLLISIDFFADQSTDKFDGDGSTGGSGAIQAIRDNVSIWYYAIRNIALGILLCIFIYVAIRMILSTVASDKAVYKKMLEDWIVGIVLLFMLHYIIVGSIMLNNVLVENVMEGALQASAASEPGGVDEKTLGDFTEELRDIAYTVTGWINGRPPSATRTWGAAIVYIIVVFLTLTFLYKYIMRMLTIAFLIIISPLITITYSIDKMGDGKSQALNTWLKEFEYNILIQPFHCIMYLVFVKTAIDILDGTLAGMVLAILCMKFIWDGEKIIKNIFGFNNAKSVGESVLAAAGAVTTMKMVGGLAKKATPGAIKGTGGNGGGGNPALAGGGGVAKNTQSPELKNTDKIEKSLANQEKQSNPTRQKMADAFSDPNKSLKEKMGAGAKIAAGGARDRIADAGKNTYKRATNTIKGVASNPGALARSAVRGTARATFAAIAMGAALATGNIGAIPSAMEAGWNIGGYVGAKGTKGAERRALERNKEKFKENAKKTGDNLSSLAKNGDKETKDANGNIIKTSKFTDDEKQKLDQIKENAAKTYREDRNGNPLDANQAFGEDSVNDMIKDYKKNGSTKVNDQYDDAVAAFSSNFSSLPENATKSRAEMAQKMLEIGNLDADKFQENLLAGKYGDSDEAKAAAYNFYDASQRKTLIDNADSLQGQEMQNGNTDAGKDVANLMDASINGDN